MKFRLHPLLLTNIFLGIFSLIVTSAVADNAKKPYWQDVQVVAVNKEYPRSSFMTYDNREDALSGKFERSKFYRLLNGTWKFYFVDSYKDLPDNITDPSVSTDSWYDIQVPGNWEVQGHGVAIYTNHGYTDLLYQYKKFLFFNTIPQTHSLFFCRKRLRWVYIAVI